MAACPRLSTGDAFLSSLLRHVDCQAQSIGADGYQALANPASPMSLALTGLLTLFIALFGLRMMFGRTPTVQDGLMAVIKIGVVLTIASSWPAYRTVVYDVIVHGPTQISTTLARASGLPGAGRDQIEHFQAADIAIIRLTTLGSGRNDLASQPPAGAMPGVPPPRTPITDDAGFGAARVLFLSSTIAAFAVVRLIAGLLLALAPLFAGLLLFDIARGIFVGWVRTLVFTMLASIAVTICLGVELALLEPWLTKVLELRQAKVITASAPIELLILCLAFTLTIFGSLGILARLAFMLHVPFQPQASADPATATAPVEIPVRLHAGVDAHSPSPRVEAVAGALASTVRREQAALVQTSVAALAMPRTGRSSHNSFTVGDQFAIPSSAHALRRAKPRKSLGAVLRDRRS